MTATTADLVQVISRAVLTLDGDYDLLINSNDLEAIKGDLEQDIATALGVFPENVEVNTITKGSVIVAFTVHWPVEKNLLMVNETFASFQKAVDNGTIVVTVADGEGVDQAITVLKVGILSQEEIFATKTTAAMTPCPTIASCNCPTGFVQKTTVDTNGCSSCSCEPNSETQDGTESPTTKKPVYLWALLGTLIAITVIASSLAIFCFVTRSPPRQDDNAQDEVVVGAVVPIPNILDDCSPSRKASRVMWQAARDAIAVSSSGSTGTLRLKDAWRDQHYHSVNVNGAVNSIQTPSANPAGQPEYLECHDLTGNPRKPPAPPSERLSLESKTLSRALPALRGLGTAPTFEDDYIESLGNLGSPVERSTSSQSQQRQQQANNMIDVDNCIARSEDRPMASWETHPSALYKATVRRKNPMVTLSTDGSISSLADSVRSTFSSPSDDNLPGTPDKQGKKTKRRKKRKKTSLV